MMQKKSDAREFSHVVSVIKLGASGVHYRLTADLEARLALAKRFGFISLDRFEASVHVTREGEGVRVSGVIGADLVQPCVVSLGPVPETVSVQFASRYLPGIDEDEADRLALEAPSEEIIEPLMGDSIDIGELVAQELSVAVEPYPRVVGVALPSVGSASGDDGDGVEVRRNPFDALAALKNPAALKK